MNKLTIVSDILDTCSKEQLSSVFSSIVDLPTTSSKVEKIHHCLNKELGGYGFQSTISADQTSILINDDTMSYVVDFFSNKGYQPYITKEQVDRVRTIHKVSSDNNINIIWAQAGLKKKYYYLKQYGFNGVNLYNVINMNTLNAGAAAISANGAARLSMPGVLALSWSGSLFLSAVEHYIPTNMVKTKVVVSGAKVVLSFPIRTVEWTSNAIFGCVEKIIVGNPLPTNITEVYKLNEGPNLKNLAQIKKPVIEWLIEWLKKL